MWKHLILPLGLLIVLSACGKDDASETTPTTYKLPGQEPTAPSASTGEPKYIKVDHILIGVRSPQNTKGRRDPVQAKKYAYALFDDLKKGAPWAELKRLNSEDPPPGGPYGMSNTDVPERDGYIPRGRMVSAFGDVGFKLKVGEMGMADWDLRTSKYGYHIIKRVE